MALYFIKDATRKPNFLSGEQKQLESSQLLTTSLGTSFENQGAMLDVVIPAL